MGWTRSEDAHKHIADATSAVIPQNFLFVFAKQRRKKILRNDGAFRANNV
jgi:hypothetical protein